MFENRSERTFDAQGADDPKTTSLRNQLVAWCKHIATEAVKMRALGNRSALVDSFVAEALEAASYAIDVDPADLARLNWKADLVFQLVEYLASEKKPEYQKDVEKQLVEQENNAVPPDASALDELVEQGKEYASDVAIARLGATVYGLQETVLDGLKGAAAEARRALDLAQKAIPQREFEAQGLRARLKGLRARDVKEKELKASLIAEANKLETETVEWREKERLLVDGLYETLAFLATDPTDVDALLDAAVDTGKLTKLALEILELGTFFAFGTPAPTVVRASAVPGKCVLFSGDDFDVLLDLLEQAEPRDVNVWTRGEAVAAHSFPAFKKYRRLVGHYGGSWAEQRKEFGAFPGAILVASTPLEAPDESYGDYLFAAGPSRWSGIARIEKKKDGKRDFSALLRAANDSPGFFKAKPSEKIAVGFGGEGLDGMIDKMARAFRQDRFKKVFVVGGEDGPESERDYFGELFDAIPQDSAIVAFGDVKFRFNRKPATPTAFGTPRTLDLGRLCDADAVFRFAEKFGSELDRTPETTPIAFFLSGFGEKTIATLLAIVAQGYREIFVGPTVPAFWTPELVAILAEKFGVRIVDRPETDLATVLE